MTRTRRNGKSYRYHIPEQIGRGLLRTVRGERKASLAARKRCTSKDPEAFAAGVVASSPQLRQLSPPLTNNYDTDDAEPPLLTPPEAAMAFLEAELPKAELVYRKKLLNIIFRLGNPQTMRDLRQMLRSWRQAGVCPLKLVYGRVGEQELRGIAHGRDWLQGLDGNTAPDGHFIALWDRAIRTGASIYLLKVQHRLGMAEVYDRYAQLEAALSAEVGPKQASAIITRRTYFWLYGTPERNKIDLTSYNHLIKAGKRYSWFRDEFGPGMLALIPRRGLTRLITEDFKHGDRELLFRAIRRYNPCACALAERLEEYLDIAWEDLAIPREPTRLERCTKSELLVAEHGGDWLQDDALGDDFSVFQDIDWGQFGSDFSSSAESDSQLLLTHTQELGMHAASDATSFGDAIEMGEQVTPPGIVW